jgi:hypothetical protein
MDKTLLVKLTQGNCQAAGQAKEASYFHRLAEEPIEWLAARVLEYK